MFLRPDPTLKTRTRRNRIQPTLVIAAHDTPSTALDKQLRPFDITLSADRQSYARVILRFRSRRVWTKTEATVDRLTKLPFNTLIDPAGLGFDLIDKPAWRNRRMEDWRRIKLCLILTARAQNCALILGDKSRRLPFWYAGLLAFLILRRPLSTRLFRSKHSAQTYLGHLTSSVHIATPPQSVALNKLISRATKTAQYRLAEDLRLVRDTLINTKPTRPFCGTGRWHDDTKLRIANHTPTGGELSEFLLHTKIVEDWRGTDSEFLQWYLHAPANRDAGFTKPVPSAILRHQCTDMTNSSALTARVLEFANRSTDFGFLPKTLCARLKSPFAGIKGNPSTFEILSYIHDHPHDTSLPADLSDLDRSGRIDPIRDWFAHRRCARAPALQIFATSNVPQVPARAPRCLTIAGVTEGQTGLARNTAMSRHALTLANIPLYPPDDLLPPSRMRLTRAVTLHHANADQIPAQILASPPSLHIGFLLWELESLPQSHALACKMLDEIWVPSGFLRDIYQPVFQNRVVNVKKGLALPEVEPSDLGVYDFGTNVFVFLICFDAHSSVERKNPLAAVTAFCRAFPYENVRLIVKTTPVGPSHWGDPNGQMHAIRKIAKTDPRIKVDERVFSFRSLLSLIKRADCIVSSHRAEGFGYVPAYALWYGRPVIATDYSGTRDFCTNATAYPVGYNLVTARVGETIAPVKNGKWADIDVPALAHAMRQVHENPSAALARAQTGKNIMRTRYSIENQAQRYLTRLRALGVVD